MIYPKIFITIPFQKQESGLYATNPIKIMFSDVNFSSPMKGNMRSRNSYDNLCGAVFNAQMLVLKRASQNHTYVSLSHDRYLRLSLIPTRYTLGLYTGTYQ